MTTKTTMIIPESCDYLVVGAGATGMSFVDTLLKHNNNKKISVVLIDNHASPGGQWDDSYDFVRLHQPSSMYGVENFKLEPSPDDGDDNSSDSYHRATRTEILEYYDRVRTNLESNHDFRFLGSFRFDFSQIGREQRTSNSGSAVYRLESTDSSSSDKATPCSIRVLKRVVDARYLQPDLPVFIPPKFTFDPSVIKCIPVNELVGVVTTNNAEQKREQRYVVIGGGKTGMDAIVCLLSCHDVDPDDIVWVVPNEAWITARENIGSCMELLHTCCVLAKEKHNGAAEQQLEQFVHSEDFFRDGFLEWERLGKVYRLESSSSSVPTKFKDATLSKDEMKLIRKVQRVVRNKGRVERITDEGDLVFPDGTAKVFDNDNNKKTTVFVHCSAGAFNYTHQTEQPPPVFDGNVLTIQDVYGTPGFCFVGSIIGFLESFDDEKMNDSERNAMCLAPTPDPHKAKAPLGPSGGDIGVISKDHGLVQRTQNLRRWLKVPEIRSWLVTNRLFNLKHLTLDEIETMMDEVWNVLKESKVVE